MLGIKLTHSTPRRPQGRGKIERLFRTVREQFLVEITGDPGQAGRRHVTGIGEQRTIQLADGSKLDKNKNADKFEFDAKDDSLGGPAHVKVHAPSGQVLISGAVCSSGNGQCESFTKVPLTVP